MSTDPDAELLRRYAQEGSQDAFAALVRRHVDWIYGVALRQAGDAHRAQEVTQMTFATLARKARALLGHPALPAWLYRTTSYEAATLRRAEARRTLYERGAAAEAERAAATPALEWETLRPVLDTVVAELGEKDRRAIVLRFFANTSFAEVGRSLGLSENAARMRVSRALEALRARLARHGITSTAAAIGLVLDQAAIAAAAPGGVVSGAVACGLAASGGGAMSSGAIVVSFMSSIKVQMAAAALVIAAGGSLLVQGRSADQRLRSQTTAMAAQAGDAATLARDNRQFQQTLDEAAARRQAVAGFEAAKRQLGEARARTAELAAALRAKGRTAGARLGKVYDSAALDVQPTAIVQGPPTYPPASRQAGKNGRVMVDFVLDASGAVHNAYAASSSDPDFEASAVAAVSQWVFSPGVRQGDAVAVHMQIPIVYIINNDAPSSSPAAAAAAAPSPVDWFSPRASHGG